VLGENESNLLMFKNCSVELVDCSKICLRQPQKRLFFIIQAFVISCFLFVFGFSECGVMAKILSVWKV